MEQIVNRHDVELAILDWLTDDPVCCRISVEFEVGTEKVADVMEDLASNEALSIEGLEEVAPGRIRGAISTNECLGNCCVEGKEAFQLSGRISGDGRVTEVLLGPDRETIDRRIASMEEGDHSVTVETIMTSIGEGSLTDDEELVLRIALDRGFFDSPESMTMDTLATRLGRTTSEVEDVIRAAERKVLEERFPKKT
jgi:predicted DNA binding protein